MPRAQLCPVAFSRVYRGGRREKGRHWRHRLSFMIIRSVSAGHQHAPPPPGPGNDLYFSRFFIRIICLDLMLPPGHYRTIARWTGKRTERLYLFILSVDHRFNGCGQCLGLIPGILSLSYICRVLHQRPRIDPSGPRKHKKYTTKLSCEKICSLSRPSAKRLSDSCETFVRTVQLLIQNVETRTEYRDRSKKLQCSPILKNSSVFNDTLAGNG